MTHETHSILEQVAAERDRQDRKWGGPAHDDRYSTADMAQLIEDYTGWARTMASMQNFDKAKRRLIQVAALAVAAAETIERAEMNNLLPPSNNAGLIGE